jgi:hypothetical protein
MADFQAKPGRMERFGATCLAREQPFLELALGGAGARDIAAFLCIRTN